MTTSTTQARETGPYVCPPTHDHGITATCQTSHGCRCHQCREAHTEYKFYRDNMVRAGKWDRGNVDATGTRRRLEALALNGWSTIALAAALGTSQGQVCEIGRQQYVTPYTRDRVKALFAKAWNTPPPGGRSKRTTNLARKKGFAPALAWDNIDDPDEVPNLTGAEAADYMVDEVAVERALAGRRQRLTPAEKRAAVTRAHSWRWSDTLTAQRLRITDQTVFRIRGELGLEAWPIEVQISRRDAA